MMALLFCDGFDWGVTADLTKKWSGYSSFAVSAGTRNGNAVYRSGAVGSGEYVYKNLSATHATLVMGAAVKLDTVPGSGAVQLFAFADGGTFQCSLWAKGDGSLVVSRSGGGISGPPNVLGTSATGIISAGAWFYVEFKATISDASGTFDVQVGGVNVLSGSSVDTKQTANAYAGSVWLGGGGYSTPGYVTGVWFDDVYVCDTSGSYNTSFLGEIKVDTLRPTSDSSPLQWSSTGGSHYTEVDEAAYSAADYLTGTTSGHRDQFGVGDLSVTPASIFAVVVNSMAKKSDAGAASLKQYVKSSASENLSSGSALSTSTLNYQHVVERDPNGTIAWAKSSVDASEIGVEVV